MVRHRLRAFNSDDAGLQTSVSWLLCVIWSIYILSQKGVLSLKGQPREYERLGVCLVASQKMEWDSEANLPGDLLYSEGQRKLARIFTPRIFDTSSKLHTSNKTC